MKHRCYICALGAVIGGGLFLLFVFARFIWSVIVEGLK